MDTKHIWKEMQILQPCKAKRNAYQSSTEAALSIWQHTLYLNHSFFEQSEFVRRIRSGSCDTYIECYFCHQRLYHRVHISWTSRTLSLQWNAAQPHSKKKQVALNNVKNKLVHIVTAMVKNKQVFNPIYRISA